MAYGLKLRQGLPLRRSRAFAGRNLLPRRGSFGRRQIQATVLKFGIPVRGCFQSGRRFRITPDHRPLRLACDLLRVRPVKLRLRPFSLGKISFFPDPPSNPRKDSPRSQPRPSWLKEGLTAGASRYSLQRTSGGTKINARRLGTFRTNDSGNSPSLCWRTLVRLVTQDRIQVNCRFSGPAAGALGGSRPMWPTVHPVLPAEPALVLRCRRPFAACTPPPSPPSTRSGPIHVGAV